MPSRPVKALDGTTYLDQRAKIDVAELVKDYRPQLFEQVVGQKHTVRYLSELVIRGNPTRPGDPDRRGRNVLLYGSVGSGKTTLARIYARAVNCERIDKNTGSPCGPEGSAHLCDRCNEWFKGPSRLFTEVDVPKFQSSERIRVHLELQQSLTYPGVKKVIFIDEAHSLARFRQTIDALLKPIEDAPEDLLFILATSELDELPTALKSRFPLLPVWPLSITDARHLQQRVLTAEKIKDYDLAALDLIAGLSMYQPRDILNNLEKILPLPVSTENVRQIFGASDVMRLIAYFRSLSIGDDEDAMMQFLDWPDDDAVKIRLVRNFILLIYYRYLRSMDVVIDPLVNSIEVYRTNEIIDAFRARVEGAGGSLDVFWLRMVAFWREYRPIADDAIILQFVLFHDLVCDLKIAPPTSSLDASVSVGIKKKKAYKNDDLLGLKYVRRRRAKIASLPDHLDYEQVRDILNTAYLPHPAKTSAGFSAVVFNVERGTRRYGTAGDRGTAAK